VVAALVRRTLSYLALGWVDRLGGALAGIALGILALGTATYLLHDIDESQVKRSIQASQLARAISGASLISSPSP